MQIFDQKLKLFDSKKLKVSHNYNIFNNIFLI